MATNRQPRSPRWLFNLQTLRFWRLGSCLHHCLQHWFSHSWISLKLHVIHLPLILQDELHCLFYKTELPCFFCFRSYTSCMLQGHWQISSFELDISTHILDKNSLFFLQVERSGSHPCCFSWSSSSRVHWPSIESGTGTKDKKLCKPLTVASTQRTEDVLQLLAFHLFCDNVYTETNL